MTVNELIKKLKQVDGNLKVAVYADHGQSAYEADSAGLKNVDEDGDLVHPDDMEEDYETESVFVISGG